MINHSEQTIEFKISNSTANILKFNTKNIYALMNYIIIGSGNGVLPVGHQAIT